MAFVRATKIKEIIANGVMVHKSLIEEIESLETLDYGIFRFWSKDHKILMILSGNVSILFEEGEK